MTYQENFELSKSKDVSQKHLDVTYIQESIAASSEAKRELNNLYHDIMNGWSKSEKKDISSAQDKLPISWEKAKSALLNYFNDIKDKPRAEVKKEWGARVFALQVFLKQQGLYTGKIDGFYGKANSLTYKAAKEFQTKNNIKIDGRAGKETIGKILERLQGASIIDQVKDIWNNMKKQAQQEIVNSKNMENIEQKKLDIIKKLGLLPIIWQKDIFTRKGYEGNYAFDKNGQLFYYDQKLWLQKYTGIAPLDWVKVNYIKMTEELPEAFKRIKINTPQTKAPEKKAEKKATTKDTAYSSKIESPAQ